MQILGKSDQTSENWEIKSKPFFVVPKTISVIPYPYNFLVSYLLSLKLFCQLSLIPKAPNRASLTQEEFQWLCAYKIKQ